MKPILFNGDMVRAILEGRKTVTRRPIDRDISNGFDIDTDGSAYVYINQATGDSFKPEEICRYRFGDILYVRETFCPVEPYTATNLGRNFIYRADGDINDCCTWRPSIHMPREAARIFLRVTGVSVERLQEITLEGIEQEGFYCDLPYTKDHYAYAPGMRIHFSKVWDEIYAGKGYGWEQNPWVEVDEFERVAP